MKKIHTLVLILAIVIAACEKSEDISIVDGLKNCPLNWMLDKFGFPGTNCDGSKPVVEAVDGDLMVKTLTGKLTTVAMTPGDARSGARNAFQALGNFKTTLKVAPVFVDDETDFVYHLMNTKVSADYFVALSFDSPHEIRISKKAGAYDISITNGGSASVANVISGLLDFGHAELSIACDVTGTKPLIKINVAVFDKNGKAVANESLDAASLVPTFVPQVKIKNMTQNATNCMRSEWKFQQFDYQDDANSKIVSDAFSCNTIFPF